MANKLIHELYKVKGLRIECPECGSLFPIKKAELFDINDKKHSPPIDKKIDSLTQAKKNEFESLNETRREILKRRKEIRAEPENIKKKVIVSTESINFGVIIEEIAPSLKSFPYKPKDCRQLFDPIDYVVFNGLHNNGNINELTFIDVKTGNAKLKSTQREIKSAIENGKITYLSVEDTTNE